MRWGSVCTTITSVASGVDMQVTHIIMSATVSAQEYVCVVFGSPIATQPVTTPRRGLEWSQRRL